MARSVNAITTEPTATTAFPNAEQAADYDEDVVTRTRGTRPRRSEYASSLERDIGLNAEPESSTVESDSVAASPPRKGPNSSGERTETVTSSLFDGGLARPLDSAERHLIARTGSRGWLNRFGLHLQPGPVELDQIGRVRDLAAAQTRIRQATWTRAVSVLVANPKGGTGKTPLSLLLGGTLASIRGGSVAVIEVADDPGALSYRAEGTPRLGIGDLVRDAATIRTAGQLAGYTAPQTSFAAVIGSADRRPRLEAGDVAAMVQVIDEYYSIRVMDSGNQPTSSAFQGALAATDVLVVPVVNAGDSTLEAVRMLEGLRESGGHAADVAESAIVVRVTDGRPESDAINTEVARVMTAAGAAAICDLPYDSHIAERGQLTLGNLNETTRDALTRIAATVVRALNDHARTTDKEVTR